VTSKKNKLSFINNYNFVFIVKEYKIDFDNKFYQLIKNFPLNKFEYNNNSYFDKSSNREVLKKEVDKYIHPIAQEHSSKLEDVWIQKYNKLQFHDLHIHGQNNYSFVWYIDCSEKSSKTIFHNPGYPYIDTQRVEVIPSKGKFILFDGVIPHYVLPNNDSKRLIVSGNLLKHEK
jgi:hypothetical protein